MLTHSSLHHFSILPLFFFYLAVFVLNVFKGGLLGTGFLQPWTVLTANDHLARHSGLNTSSFSTLKIFLYCLLAMTAGKPHLTLELAPLWQVEFISQDTFRGFFLFEDIISHVSRGQVLCSSTLFAIFKSLKFSSGQFWSSLLQIFPPLPELCFPLCRC